MPGTWYEVLQSALPLVRRPPQQLILTITFIEMLITEETQVINYLSISVMFSRYMDTDIIGGCMEQSLRSFARRHGPENLPWECRGRTLWSGHRQSLRHWIEHHCVIGAKHVAINTIIWGHHEEDVSQVSVHILGIISQHHVTFQDIWYINVSPKTTTSYKGLDRGDYVVHRKWLRLLTTVSSSRSFIPCWHPLDRDFCQRKIINPPPSISRPPSYICARYMLVCSYCCCCCCSHVNSSPQSSPWSQDRLQ